MALYLQCPPLDLLQKENVSKDSFKDAFVAVSSYIIKRKVKPDLSQDAYFFREKKTERGTLLNMLVLPIDLWSEAIDKGRFSQSALERYQVLENFKLNFLREPKTLSFYNMNDLQRDFYSINIRSIVNNG